MNYLERYINGEQQQVWAELIAMGGNIRKETLYREAYAVVRETMRRVRHNIETLVARLNQLGFEFVNTPFEPPNPDFLENITMLEDEAGLLPLSLKVFYQEVGYVNFMGNHPLLCEYVKPAGNEMAVDFLNLYRKEIGPVPDTGNPTLQSARLSFGMLGELLKNMSQPGGYKPDSKLDNFAQSLEKMFTRPASQPQQVVPDVYTDPLVVDPPYEDDLEAYQRYDAEGNETEGFTVEIAPDICHKHGYSGGGPLEIYFPDEAIDAQIQGDEGYGYFVEYLRNCFKWGGFPGLKNSKTPPATELAFLTKDLLGI
jgi:hypothetical protein